MPKSIRGILDDLWYRGWVANTHDREKEVTSAEAQIKAMMDEGEIGEILKDYSISPRGRRYLINAIKAWWEGKL